MSTSEINNNLFSYGTMLSHGAIAFFGALAHAINAHRNGKTKGLVDFALLTIMSSFSGVVFALVASWAFDSFYLTLAMSGAGGFLGVEGLTVLATKLRDSMSNLIDKK